LLVSSYQSRLEADAGISAADGGQATRVRKEPAMFLIGLAIIIVVLIALALPRIRRTR
jgi:hypothetical protein